MSGADAMAKAGIATLDTLVCKEGLGMTNGTCAMTSVRGLSVTALSSISTFSRT